MYNFSENCNLGLGRIILTMTVVMTFSFVSFCFPALLLIQYMKIIMLYFILFMYLYLGGIIIPL